MLFKNVNMIKVNVTFKDVDVFGITMDVNRYGYITATELTEYTYINVLDTMIELVETDPDFKWYTPTEGDAYMQEFLEYHPYFTYNEVIHRGWLPDYFDETTDRLYNNFDSYKDTINAFKKFYRHNSNAIVTLEWNRAALFRTLIED